VAILRFREILGKKNELLTFKFFENEKSIWSYSSFFIVFAESKCKTNIGRIDV